MYDLLATIDRFYYAPSGVYRLECAGEIIRTLEMPTDFNSPENILYITLDTHRMAQIHWQAVGRHADYGWIFERGGTPNDPDTDKCLGTGKDFGAGDDTEPIRAIDRHCASRADEQVQMKRQSEWLLKDADCIYIAQNGTIRVAQNGKVVRTLRKPGERNNSPIAALYRAIEAVRQSEWTVMFGFDKKAWGRKYERKAVPTAVTSPIIDLERDAAGIRDAETAREWIMVTPFPSVIKRFHPLIDPDTDKCLGTGKDFGAGDTPFAPDDVVEMQSVKHGLYFGTVLAVDPATCRVKVEYFHPGTREYWRGWREYSEVTVIHKTAKTAA